MATNVQNITQKNNNFRGQKNPLVHTSAQLRTEPSKKKCTNPLKNRALAKYFSREIILSLIDLDSPLKNAYWRTWHCSNILLQDGKKITGKYCNGRWCLVCNRIRTAKLIEGYLPVIKREFKDPYYTTLTVPNVPAQELESTIQDMVKTSIKINDIFRNRRDFQLKGIRKIEVTYNRSRNDYHPHLHELIDGKQVADALVKEWLNHYPDADRKGQDLRPADPGSLIELFKYSTKISAKSKNDAEALDVIFKALYKKRVFQPIGLKKVSVSEDIDGIQAQEIEHLKSAVDVWCWEQDLKDWINSSGEFLTKYTTQ